MFFDERFNFIAAADGGVAQQQVASSWTTSTPGLTLTNIKAPKNGYVFVYVSNRSDQDVYFDNLVVNSTAGNIIEEDHYYAFGLKIAAISSKKLGDAGEGKLSNSYLYNEKEMLDEDAGLNWYDYGFRNYDPQIGRFMQLDPLTNSFADLTAYQFAGNDPIANVDLDGLEPSNVTSFIKSLGDAAENVSTKFFESGANAGHWSVSWVQGGVVRAMIFKASPFASNTLKLVSIATKAATLLNVAASTIQTGGGGDTWKSYLVLVATRGASDALANANSLGIYDFFGGNHVNSYNTSEEKDAYLRGRIVGAGIAIGQGFGEIDAGTGAAVAGLATGPGAAILSTAGALTALHGAGVGAIATADITKSELALYKLNMSSNGVSSPNAGGSSGQFHHISTDKHFSKWTPLFQKFFNGAGLNISKAKENIVYVFDHVGPHPDEYHEYVFEELNFATKGLQPYTTEYSNAVRQTLERIGKSAQTSGSYVNKLITK